MGFSMRMYINKKGQIFMLIMSIVGGGVLPDFVNINMYICGAFKHKI